MLWAPIATAGASYHHLWFVTYRSFLARSPSALTWLCGVKVTLAKDKLNHVTPQRGTLIHWLLILPEEEPKP